jgi:hypothetical protein
VALHNFTGRVLLQHVDVTRFLPSNFQKLFGSAHFSFKASTRSKDTFALRILGMSACFALATISAKAEEVNSEATSEQIKTPQAEAANAEPTVNAQSLQQQEAANEAHSIVTIPILSSTADLYGGISINQSDLPSSVVEFQQRLEASLALWTEQGKRGIWLTIPMEQVELVPIAVKMG